MTRFCKPWVSAAILACGLLCVPLAGSAEDSAVDAGKGIAFDRKQGNCLACHMIEGGESPGNIGPPLVHMQSRYPDKAKLRAQIWDPAVANAETAMPPFGKHKILSEEQIDKVVEFIWSL